MPTTVASDCTFSDLCKLLEAVSRSNQKAERRRNTLKNFIDLWRQRHREFHGDSKTDDSFYPAMRLILPSFDKERGAYGFKEHMLAKKLIDVLGMDKKGADAQCLLHYQSPSHFKAGYSEMAGDFATVASNVLKYRIDSGSSMNLEDLNGRLDNLADANVSKDKGAVEREIEWLCRNVGPIELKWLIRILLKQMKMGMQETTILNLFHPEASQLYDVTMSLRKVCELLHDPATRLDTIQIQLFTPFRPMLANRAAPEKVPDIMGNKPFYVETKYDGERCQLHTNGREFKYFSRNGNELTLSYGGDRKSGSFTPFIHEAFRNVKDCILDGEMIGWNPQAKCIATKGDHFDVKALKDDDDLKPCFVAFDCLMFNGRVLTLKSLQERVEILRNIFPEIEGRLMYAQQDVKTNVTDVYESLNVAIERRDEGIVIKRMDSTYRLNVRTNEAGWLKIKPDYVDSICDDLELIIIGGYFGDGRRSNLMSHFLLAVGEGDKSDEADGKRSVNKFLSVCKVGSGYSMKELYDLNLYLNDKCTLNVRKPPDWCVVSSERPDIYIDPKNSKLLQVRAAEIISSKSFAVGYTLRFPRVEKIRDDKNLGEVLTLDEFHKLRQEFSTKLAQKSNYHGQQQLGDDVFMAGESPKKRRAGATSSRVIQPTLGPQFRPADLKKVKSTGNAFKNKEFCVLNGPNDFNKAALEVKIKELGGDVVQHASCSTYCVVAERKVINMKAIEALKFVNIVKAPWLIECIKERRMIRWKPSDLWFCTEETAKMFRSEFDEYGDSYTALINEEELKSILKNVEPKDLSAEEFADVQFEIFPDYKYGLFRRCNVYVDQYAVIGDISTKLSKSGLDLVSRELKLYGANVLSNVAPNCCHVIVDSGDLTRYNEFLEINRQRTRKFHITDQHWVRRCIQENKIIES